MRLLNKFLNFSKFDMYHQTYKMTFIKIGLPIVVLFCFPFVICLYRDRDSDAATISSTLTLKGGPSVPPRSRAAVKRPKATQNIWSAQSQHTTVRALAALKNKAYSI